MKRHNKMWNQRKYMATCGKYRGSAKGKDPTDRRFRGGPNQRPRPISGGEIAQNLIMRRRARENYCGFIHGCVEPSEVHQGEKRST
jgi:hypothetical protein